MRAFHHADRALPARQRDRRSGRPARADRAMGFRRLDDDPIGVPGRDADGFGAGGRA